MPPSCGTEACSEVMAPATGPGMPAPDRLLVRLTLARPTPAEAEEARRLAAGLSDTEWRRFRRLLRHNDVAPLVWMTSHRLGVWESLPPSVQQAIAARRTTVEQQARVRLARAGELFDRLAARGIPVIVLKGVAFGETIYADPAYKKMNDLDLLFRPADVPALREVLRDLDLVPLALLDGGDEEDDPQTVPDPRRSYHLPAHVSRDLTFVLGLHWGLVNPKTGYRLDYDGIWARRQPLVVAGRTVAALSPLDALHHLGVHFHYYKTGLKELGDVANLVRAHPDFDWDTFGRMVEEAGTATAVFRPLRLVEAMYGLTIPARWMQRWRATADPFAVQDTERLAGRADLLAESRSTWSSEIEKAYLAFTFENRFTAKAKWWATFWHRLLLPPRQVFSRTNACRPGERSPAWLFAMNLWRTAREVGRDYGLAVFGLLMLKSLLELAASLLASGRGSRRRMDELRERLGQDEAKIMAFMASFD